MGRALFAAESEQGFRLLDLLRQDYDVVLMNPLYGDTTKTASELRRLADWGYDPDLNDGVIINIAPLHRLVPWKEAEKMWRELEQGRYEWSTMAKKVKR